jgi:cell wall assembly regulator SMI1
MRWVRGDSADHTSCNYSFAFFTCLLSRDPETLKPTFNTAYGNYVAQDLCTSLAATCRIYNDIGSFARDAEEKNVNSRNFPEFTNCSMHKVELLEIVGYEQEKIASAFEKLEKVLRPAKKMRVMEAVKLFTNVTNSYGQIYLARDIGTKTKVNGSS